MPEKPFLAVQVAVSMFDAAWNFFTGPFPALVDFLASTITLVLGFIALWTLYKHRGELSVFLRVMTNSHLGERFRRIRMTIASLDSLNYANKEHRQEIKALFGKLSGHIRSLPDSGPEIMNLDKRISEILAKPSTMTEARKRAITHELDGLLDNVANNATTDLLKLHE